MDNQYTEQGILEIDPFQTIDIDGVGALIKSAVQQAKVVNPQLKIGVCGELGGDSKSIAYFNQLSIDLPLFCTLDIDSTAFNFTLCC